MTNNRYCTIILENDDCLCMTEPELIKVGLPLGWQEYVWHEAKSKGEAINNHDLAFTKWKES